MTQKYLRLPFNEDAVERIEEELSLSPNKRTLSCKPSTRR